MIEKEVYSAIISYDSLQKLVVVRFKDGIEVDVEEMTVLVEESLKLVNNSRFCLLVDARDILSSMDHNSRKYFAEHEEYNNLNIAQAILVNNMPIRLLASAYFKLYSHKNPVKIFTDPDKAKEWLFSLS